MKLELCSPFIYECRIAMILEIVSFSCGLLLLSLPQINKLRYIHKKWPITTSRIELFLVSSTIYAHHNKDSLIIPFHYVS